MAIFLCCVYGHCCWICFLLLFWFSLLLYDCFIFSLLCLFCISLLLCGCSCFLAFPAFCAFLVFPCFSCAFHCFPVISLVFLAFPASFAVDLHSLAFLLLFVAFCFLSSCGVLFCRCSLLVAFQALSLCCLFLAFVAFYSFPTLVVCFSALLVVVLFHPKGQPKRII